VTDFSNATESAIIQHITKEGNWAALAGGPYIQLHDGDPGEAGTANTVADFDGRQLASMAAESGGAAATDADLEWVNTSGGSITVTHISVWDTVGAGNPPTGGVCSMVGDLDSSVATGDDETFRLPAGDLTLSAT
jgi:hypothetical protein